MSATLLLGKEWPYSLPTTPRLHHTQLGFIGLGAMGYYMARNLSESSDRPLIVHNRTVSKCAKLEKETNGRVVTADSIADLVDKCDVIFTNLANDLVVQAIYAQIVDALQAMPPLRPKIFVETSTIYPTTSGELDKLFSGIEHAHFVASPVFGTPPAADKKQLLIVLAGEYKIKKEIAYLVVPAIGRKIIDMGGNVEKASKLKIIGNALILGQIELLAETMTLADKAEVGATNLYDVIKEILPATPLLAYGDKILNDKFDGSVGFSLANGLKDAGHMRRLAFESNSPVPTIDTAHQNLVTARALQTSTSSVSTPRYETLDWSSLAAGVRVAAGLPGFDSSNHGGVQLAE